jgi:hypothetical protein
MRKGVLLFAAGMEERLVENDYKSGWATDKCSVVYLKKRLRNKVDGYLKCGDLISLVDAANFAMMIWNREHKTRACH